MIALYRSRVSQTRYYYGHGDERSIELSAFDSSRLWSLLDEAQAQGLPIVHTRKRGPVERDQDAELCLDVTRSGPDEPLVVVPALRIGGAQAGDMVPVRFIGAEGHGLIYAAAAQVRHDSDPAGWYFRLAKLARPVPAQLQAMALAGQRLEVRPPSSPGSATGTTPGFVSSPR